MDFKDQTILITGASRGIGRAIARAFADLNAQVVVHYNRNLAAAKETLETMKDGQHMLVQADISDADAVKNMVDAVIEKMGRIHVLVNNAGIYEEHPVADVDYQNWQAFWQRTIDTNLMGSANAAYLAARHMMKQGGGKIVNITSRGAFRGEPDGPAYGASKAGQNAMSQSLAKALAPHNIYVYAVAPGWVATEMAEDFLASPRGEEIRNQSPMRRVATPEEIANAVIFLASDGTDYMTGSILDINGASYLRS